MSELISAYKLLEADIEKMIELAKDTLKALRENPEDKHTHCLLTLLKLNIDYVSQKIEKIVKPVSYSDCYEIIGK